MCHRTPLGILESIELVILYILYTRAM